jgi:hypothetical protein
LNKKAKKAKEQKCSEVTKVTKIKVSENGKQAILLNPEKKPFTKIRMDGCVIVNSTSCDWVVQDEHMSSILIELKGSDVDHAITQIEATFAYLKDHNLLTNKSVGLIVCSKPSRSPSFTSKLQKAKARLSTKYKAPLHVVVGNFEYKLDRLLMHTGPH